MPDYYATDVTLLPYSEIFHNKHGWSLFLKLVFALRKAVNLPFLPASARAIRVGWTPLAVADLPSSLQENFQKHIALMETSGFRQIGISKADTIGTWVEYTCICLSEDRTTFNSLFALRMAVGTASHSAWNLNFRSELSNGDVLLTTRTSHLNPAKLTPRYRHEGFSGETPTETVRERHRARVQELSPEQILLAPEENPVQFLQERSLADVQGLFESGRFRKLTEREVAKLRAVKFDFD